MSWDYGEVGGTQMRCKYYTEEHIMICCPPKRYYMFDQLEKEGKTLEEIRDIMHEFCLLDEL